MREAMPLRVLEERKKPNEQKEVYEVKGQWISDTSGFLVKQQCQVYIYVALHLLKSYIQFIDYKIHFFAGKPIQINS